MKTRSIIVIIIFISTNTFGQFMGYLTQFQNSDEDIAFAEITLVHRTLPSEISQVYIMGTSALMIPKSLNGKVLKMESNSFWVRNGSYFIKDSKSYVEVILSYDSGTIEPTDDYIVAVIPFEVEKALMDRELAYYQRKQYKDYHFSNMEKER
ncbi:MAG: hypothetical protein M3Q56_03085 [Bacteroidota bacterium]|nr:hypothetical protein [Bacteroidota bacterium]